MAAPTEVEKRIKYTTSLNAMAAIVMNWYGSLITSNEQVTFVATEKQWDDYRSQYPENITQIQITSTDLIRLDTPNQYQFMVESLMRYHKAGGEHSQQSSDIFIFQVDALTKPIIKTISRKSLEKTTSEKETLEQIVAFNRSHYKVREFAYSWLAYLDGVEVLPSEINMREWTKQANYMMKIGGKKIEGSVDSVLNQRKQYLAKGGHLLRSLDVEHKPGTKVVDLILEWKGVNQAGKPVLAKIHQKIEYQIEDNQSWRVISIKEEHLLPDIAPWVGLLC
ncbi:MAG: hypothetical protein ACKE8R_05710 [Methylophagaceae bacterium]